jgi:hypothetical protein
MVCVARFLPGPSNRTRCARLRRIPRAEPTASATELAPASYGMALHAHLRLVAPIRTIPLAPLESAAVEPVRLVRQCHAKLDTFARAVFVRPIATPGTRAPIAIRPISSSASALFVRRPALEVHVRRVRNARPVTVSTACAAQLLAAPCVRRATWEARLGSATMCLPERRMEPASARALPQTR